MGSYPITMLAYPEGRMKPRSSPRNAWNGKRSPALEHFWSGHAHTHVSERYTKLLQDRDYRLEWAEKIGMGFNLPARSVAPRAPLIMFRKIG